MNLTVSQRQKSSSEIFKDIYGNRAEGFYVFGLAQATDRSDFDITVFSLKEKQESQCPVFHDWFKRKKIDYFVVREGTDVKELYFLNDVESMHFLEKISKEFKKESTEILIKSLLKITEYQDLEEVQDIFHGERYTLSQPHKKFSVESSICHSWYEARHKDYVKRFHQYVPSFSDAFPKP